MTTAAAPPPNHRSISLFRRAGSGGSGGPTEITSAVRGVASRVTVPVR